MGAGPRIWRKNKGQFMRKKSFKVDNIEGLLYYRSFDYARDFEQISEKLYQIYENCLNSAFLIEVFDKILKNFQLHVVGSAPKPLCILNNSYFPTLRA